VVEILLILDGASEPLGAEPTSLELARTPELDRLASLGTVRRRPTTPDGLPPGSETAIPLLLGWTPSDPLDRGAIEAAARNADVGDGNRAWRIDVLDEDGGRAANDDVTAALRRLGSELPGHIVQSIGGHRLLAIGPAPLPVTQQPALRIWPEGSVPPRILDSNTVLVSAVGAASGIARMMGARVVNPPGATGWIDTDLDGKAAGAEEAATSGAHTVVVHVAAPDEAAHHHDRAAKIAVLERIDRELVPRLAALTARVRGRLTICPDHGCDPATGLHNSDPVPCLEWSALDPQHQTPARLCERGVLQLEAV
jgi:2,3-bisphosphoglycerate-independent phosphoglycerate mutase